MKSKTLSSIPTSKLNSKSLKGNGTNNASLILQQLKSKDPEHSSLLNSSSISKLAYVEEKSTKPPGTSKFTRKKINEINNAATMYDVAANSNKLSNDKLNSSDICQQLLISGFVQSYTDFYYLTNRNDPNIPLPTPLKISSTDLSFLRDNLVTAEVCRRQGNAVGVYTPYNNLADYYFKQMDWKTCIYFYQKYLEMTKLTNDMRAQMKALHLIGKVYQNMNETIQAIKYHEMHEKLSREYDILEEIKKANVELYKTYNLMGEKFEADKDYSTAHSYFQKCREAARASWDKHGEGEACGKIGSLYVQTSDYEQSISYLQSFAMLANDTGSTDGKCRSSGLLAIAYDALNRTEDALVELEQVQIMSEQAGDTLLQMQAYKALGIMNTKLNKFEEALQLFEKHYMLVKSLTALDYSQSTADIGANSNVVKSGNILPNSRPATSTEIKGNNNSASRPDTSNNGTLKTPSAASQSISNQPKPTHHDIDLARIYVGISRGNLLFRTVKEDLFTNAALHLAPLLEWKIFRKDVFLQNVKDTSNSEIKHSESGTFEDEENASLVPEI